MSADAIWQRIFAENGDRPKPGGSIQWKGTDVCMDISCTCGAVAHFDGDFFYFYRCSHCGASYAVGYNVKFIPLSPEEAKEIEDDGSTFQGADIFHVMGES